MFFTLYYFVDFVSLKKGEGLVGQLLPHVGVVGINKYIHQQDIHTENDEIAHLCTLLININSSNRLEKSTKMS